MLTISSRRFAIQAMDNNHVPSIPKLQIVSEWVRKREKDKERERELERERERETYIDRDYIKR